MTFAAAGAASATKPFTIGANVNLDLALTASVTFTHSTRGGRPAVPPEHIGARVVPSRS